MWLPGEEVAVAKATGRDEAGKTGPETTAQPAIRDEELERRRRELEAVLSERSEQAKVAANGTKADKAGFGQALKLSSEFIAGVVVGAGLGWIIDRWLGTSPWGLIVFLLLGFGAGVLNVMRSAGVVAEAGVRTEPRNGGPETK